MKINEKAFEKMCKYLDGEGWWGFYANEDDSYRLCSKVSMKETRQELQQALKVYLTNEKKTKPPKGMVFGTKAV